VLWLADTDFLLDQARSALEEVTNEPTTLEKAKHRMGSERIVVASMQSLRLDRLLTKPADTFDWIIPDEAHGILAPTYRQIIEHFSTAKVLGLSATPFRLDGKKVVGEGGFFDACVYEKDYQWGADEGYLCPVQPRIREVVSIDLSQVRTHGGDLKLGDLEKQIIKAAAPIARIAWEESDEGELPTIIYTPGVASAKAVAATFRALAVGRWGPEAAVSVDGETPERIRRRVKADFGKSIRAIANCDLLTQGVDLPQAKCIILGRHTMSLALFIQMALRGDRPLIPEIQTREGRIDAIAASEKPWFRLVDLSGNAGKHSLVTIVDALGGVDLSPLEREHVRKNIEKNKPARLETAVNEGKKAAADEQRAILKLQEEAIAQAAAAAVVNTIEKSWDPFKRFGVGEFKHEGLTPEWIAQQPTPEQWVWLEKRRMKTTAKHTRASVEKLQATERDWLNKGLASFNQRRILATAELPVDLSFGLAQRIVRHIMDCKFNDRSYGPRVTAMLAEGREPGED
jgi:superfamily II DNA or RNA helicase